MFRFLISILFVQASLISFGQQTESQPDSAAITKPALKDSIQKAPSKFKPTGLRVGLDLVSFGQGVQKNGIRAFTQGDVRQWKFSADIDIYRYFLNFEYGKFERYWIAPASDYYNEGSFIKVGPDINFFHKDPKQNALFIGLRYARSKYQDYIIYDYQNQVYGDNTKRVSNGELKSNWFEITTGLKVRLTRYVWSGYTARFKFRVNDNYENNALAPHWIPGYGAATRESAWGLEYWLIFRVPFKKDKIEEIK
jgi:hypothetical protein